MEPESQRPRFHCAFGVHDLAATRAFYVELLGCEEGRSAERWVDFSLFGHQLSAHLIQGVRAHNEKNPVDGDQVPIPHFGLILEWHAWQALSARLKQRGVRFVIEPRVRFVGQAGEQATMFLLDPSGNALEFKAFQDQAAIFAR
jgi:extradiol dioxygenase family protein